METHFVAGSVVEEQGYSTYLCLRKQDIDIMVKHGDLYSQDELLPVLTLNDSSEKVSGFVFVKWNAVHLNSREYAGGPDNNLYVNGYQMKQKYCSEMPTVTGWMNFNLQTFVDSASIQMTSSDHNYDMFANQMHVTLKNLTVLRNQRRSINERSHKFMHDAKGIRDICSHICQTCRPFLPDASQIIMNPNLVETMLALCGPAYDVQLSQDNSKKAAALIDYYLKYKHILNHQQVLNV
ncbi:unnamed protein product [Didymodactylos carnosus]|nr:unnamed protein product [Didymodactylos carnosus]